MYVCVCVGAGVSSFVLDGVCIIFGASLYKSVVGFLMGGCLLCRYVSALLWGDFILSISRDREAGVVGTFNSYF